MSTETLETKAGQGSRHYEAFHLRRRQLTQLVSRARSAFQRLDLGSQGGLLVRTQEKLESDCFKVMVMGEFKRGKSTVINALLGAEVLPAKVIPTTAVINEVKWGEAPRAVLHFLHPLPSQLPSKLPNEILAHLAEAGEEPAHPIEVPVSRLSEFVTIQDPAKDPKESVAQTPYEKLELFWPLELCRNGVEIIDSPGLNEHQARARITTNYLQRADAALFVMLCQPLGAVSEFRVIDDDLRGNGYKDLFFICNAYDLIRPKDRPELQQLADGKLSHRTALGRDGIFFLSAQDALEGRLKGDQRKVEGSGIQQLEEALAHFLIHERGRVKLLQPAGELSAIVAKVRGEHLPAQRRLLDENLEEIENRYREVRPQLEETGRRREQIVRSINGHRDNLCNEVQLKAEILLRQLATSLPSIVDNLQTERSIRIITKKPRQQVKELLDELAEKAGEHIQEEVRTWRENELEPLIATRLADIEEELGDQLKRFYEQIRSINMTLLQLDEIDSEKMANNPSKKRLWLHFQALEKELRKRVGREIAQGLRNRASEAAKGISDEVHKHTAILAMKAQEILGSEIQGIRDKVEAVMRDKQAGEAQVEARRCLLDETETELAEIDESLTRLIIFVADA